MVPKLFWLFAKIHWYLLMNCQTILSCTKLTTENVQDTVNRSVVEHFSICSTPQLIFWLTFQILALGPLFTDSVQKILFVSLTRCLCENEKHSVISVWTSKWLACTLYLFLNQCSKRAFKLFQLKEVFSNVMSNLCSSHLELFSQSLWDREVKSSLICLFIISANAVHLT